MHFRAVRLSFPWLAAVAALFACSSSGSTDVAPHAVGDAGAKTSGQDGGALPGDDDDQADAGSDEHEDDGDVIAGDDDAGAPTTEDAGATTGLPISKRFDLTQPSFDVFRNKSLHESHHAMQSFAFDQKNGRLFTAQIQDGSSGDDLCISQIDFTGKLLGFMHLNAAGHGVSIGVEPVGTDTYLWVETDSNNPTDSGRGTALLRFKFENGKTPTGTKFLPGSQTITCATDPINERLAVRRVEGGKFYYSVYPLASAAKGDFSAPLAHFVQPALSSAAVTFQGYTIFGQYLYTLDGTGHADAADINSYVTEIDMNTGKVKSRELTKAGSTLVFREPEGLGIYRTDTGETRLFLGFTSHDKIGGTLRYANLFYKNVLID